MLYYIIVFGIGFVVDKIKNKVVNVVFYKCSKQLLLTYTNEWHSSQKMTLLDLCDWIFC